MVGENGAPMPDVWQGEPKPNPFVDDATVLKIAAANAERWAGTLAILAEAELDGLGSE